MIAPDPMEIIAALIPGSRVSVTFFGPEAPFPWSAWIEWWTPFAHDITRTGSTKREALLALHEAVRTRKDKPQGKPVDEPAERAALKDSR